VCLSPRSYKDRIENEAAVLITDRHRTANATSSPFRNLRKGFSWWALRESNLQPWDQTNGIGHVEVCWCRPVPFHWLADLTSSVSCRLSCLVVSNLPMAERRDSSTTPRQAFGLS
jgi:hypothetical protein